MHAPLLDELRARARGGDGQRARQVAGRHESVGVDQQAAHDAVADLRLLRPHAGGVEEPRGHAPLRQRCGGAAQRMHLGFVHGDVERAGAAIRNG